MINTTATPITCSTKPSVSAAGPSPKGLPAPARLPGGNPYVFIVKEVFKPKPAY